MSIIRRFLNNRETVWKVLLAVALALLLTAPQYFRKEQKSQISTKQTHKDQQKILRLQTKTKKVMKIATNKNQQGLQKAKPGKWNLHI